MQQRLQVVCDVPPDRSGKYVLYWMIANRRLSWNYALDRAMDWCRRLGKPLVILEPLNCDYPWASRRLHEFVLAGMRDHQRQLAGSQVLYYPFVEPSPGQGRGLITSLAQDAALTVTDYFPCFIQPRLVRAVGLRSRRRLEAVDSNGLVPLSAPGKTFARAVDYRRWLQRYGVEFLSCRPRIRPGWDRLSAPVELPVAVTRRWPSRTAAELDNLTETVAALPIDQSVGSASLAGGGEAARRTLDRFVSARLEDYADDRNRLDRSATSELSGYLHFGHISAHEVLARVVRRENWDPGQLSADPPRGQRSGWWGMSESAEAFLDQLLVWRELGYNMCYTCPNFAEYNSLPGWARASLAEHASDARPVTYSLAEFEDANTHDNLWNAAQRQLVRDGQIHGYLRMLWGKKILEWSPSPQAALRTMIELNNKYAVDGRNPNSYSGIFWTLGRYDRAWGPERPIFGKIRYMSSDNTARKFRTSEYLSRYSC